MMCHEFQDHFEHPVTPEYIASHLWEPPIPVSCFTIPGMRVYAWLEDGQFQFGPGITGCFETTCDRSWLVEWVKRVGREQAEKTLAEKQDMLDYQRWQQRVQFEPLAVEVPLRSKKYGVATRIDAFGIITIGSQGYYKSGKKEGMPKGDPLRKYAIIDTKSSRKNYSSDEHAMQVLFCEHLIRENYPQQITEKEEILLFNWSPNDWESAPNYTFKQHYKDVESKALAWEELEMCIALTKLRTKYTKGQLVIKGEMTPDTDVSTLYERKAYLDMIRDELLSNDNSKEERS